MNELMQHPYSSMHLKLVTKVNINTASLDCTTLGHTWPTRQLVNMSSASVPQKGRCGEFVWSISWQTCSHAFSFVLLHRAQRCQQLFPALCMTINRAGNPFSNPIHLGGDFCFQRCRTLSHACSARQTF